MATLLRCWIRWDDLPREANPSANSSTLIGDGDAECSRNRLGNPVVVHLNRAVQRIGLAIVRLRPLEDGGDHVRLINPGDGSVTAVSERKAEHALVSPAAPPPADPFGEERRSQVRGEHRSAIEQALGEPVLARCVADGLSAGGDLRHVDDRSDAGLGGRLRERDRGVEQARGDRVEEVSPAHSSQGGAHVVEVEQVTHDDFGPRGSELPRTIVLPVHESTYPMPSFQKQLRGGVPRVPRCAGDQEEAVIVLHHARRPPCESCLPNLAWAAGWRRPGDLSPPRLSDLASALRLTQVLRVSVLGPPSGSFR